MSTGNINLMYRQKYINSFLPVELKNKSFKMFHNCKYPESVLYSTPSLQDLCKSAGISTFPRTKWYGGGRHWIGFFLCALGWSEKHKNWKMQKYRADSEPRHSTDFRTIFVVMIGCFVSCEIGQTYFTESGGSSETL